MNQYPSILRLLEAERERYILEAAELERRLNFVRNQISSLDTLIKGYLVEEQMYSNSRHLPNLDSTQAFLQHSSDSESADDELQNTSLADESSQDAGFESHQNPQNQPREQNSSLIPTSQISGDEESTNFTLEPDISDIPKLTTPRKSSQVSLLSEYQDYSVQNAILILMRRRPDLHMHIDAVVRDLYGDLSPLELKKARTNVSSALSAGSIQGWWYRVLRADGVYTLHFEKGVTAASKRK